MNWRRKKQEQEKDLHSQKYHQRVVEMKKKEQLRIQEMREAIEDYELITDGYDMDESDTH